MQASRLCEPIDLSRCIWRMLEAVKVRERTPPCTRRVFTFPFTRLGGATLLKHGTALLRSPDFHFATLFFASAVVFFVLVRVVFFFDAAAPLLALLFAIGSKQSAYCSVHLPSSKTFRTTLSALLDMRLYAPPNDGYESTILPSRLPVL